MKKNIINLIAVAFATFVFASCGGGASKDSACSDSTVVEPSTEAAMNALTEEEKANGWELLFDGTTTEHWKGYNKDSFPSGWEVIDGTIHVIGSGKGEAGQGGDIITKEKYGNFELKLEWKVSEGGNSGIFYLAQEKADQPIWKSAPEMQILDNAKHPDSNLGKDGNRKAGSLYDLIPAEPQNAKPAGEWNSIKILVYKGTVAHEMNGETVLEYHLWTDDWKNMIMNSKFKDFPDFLNTAEEGHIGLQDHGDDVWFRNIKIRRL